MTLKEAIEFYESELTSKQIEDCRAKAVEETGVTDATNLGIAYVDLLVRTYKDKLKEKYGKWQK